MSDDEGFAEMKERFESRLRAGRPILGFEFDLPIKFTRGKDGGISLDCPCLKIGLYEPAAVVRVHLTRQAIDGLMRALFDLERNSDMQVMEMKEPATN
jgi:hypothetical protein